MEFMTTESALQKTLKGIWYKEKFKHTQKAQITNIYFQNVNKKSKKSQQKKPNDKLIHIVKW